MKRNSVVILLVLLLIVGGIWWYKRLPLCDLSVNEANISITSTQSLSPTTANSETQKPGEKVLVDISNLPQIGDAKLVENEGKVDITRSTSTSATNVSSPNVTPKKSSYCRRP